MEKKTILITCGVGGATFVAGIFTGFLVAKKSLVAGYEAILAAEIEGFKDHYRKLYKADEYATPREAAEKLLPAQLYGTEPQNGPEIFEELVEEFTGEHELVNENVFDGTEEPDDETLELELLSRSPAKPYVISEEEFDENEYNHEQHELTYFSGDRVLADDQDEPIKEVEKYVGEKNLRFGYRSNDPAIVYVRNEKHDADYLIRRSHGSFRVEVQGFDPHPVVNRRRVRMSDD